MHMYENSPTPRAHAQNPGESILNIVVSRLKVLSNVYSLLCSLYHIYYAISIYDFYNQKQKLKFCSKKNLG